MFDAGSHPTYTARLGSSARVRRSLDRDPACSPSIRGHRHAQTQRLESGDGAPTLFADSSLAAGPRPSSELLGHHPNASQMPFRLLTRVLDLSFSWRLRRTSPTHLDAPAAPQDEAPPRTARRS
jgi:hypothetical protein